MMTAEGNMPGETNAHLVEIPAIVFFVLTPLFVAIRFWARSVLRTGWGLVSRESVTIMPGYCAH